MEIIIRNRISILIILLVVLSATVSSSPKYIPDDENDNFSTDLVTLNLNDASLRNTLEMLTTQLGKNLLLDREVKEQTLNMSLRNITAMQALNAILEAYNLAYREMAGGVFYIAAREKIGRQTVVKNIKLRYADATELQKVLEKMVVAESGGTIMSDKRTNTLIIKVSPDVLNRMEGLIQELDRPTKQVYIKAEILEISSTDNTELGIDFLWKTANIKSIDGRVGTDFDLQGSLSSNGEGEANIDGFPFPSGAGFGIGILNTDINAVLHALKEVNNVNLLSRPRIVTLDNQESVIEVGDQIPFRKLNEFGVTSFEFKDATVKLTVKPHIIDSEYILLQVSQKADFQNGVTADGTPIISTRNASTNVKVKNGHTIVIAGLIRDSIIKSESKVPILGDIPILGYLFKSRKDSKVKTELIVFITPIILEDEMTGDLFNEEIQKKEQFKNNLD